MIEEIDMMNPKSFKMACLLYGQSGAGKTYSFKTLNHEKTVIFSSERGNLTLIGVPIKTYYFSEWTDLLQIYEMLKSPSFQNQYTTVVLDSITDIAEICMQFVMEQYHKQKKIVKQGDIAPYDKMTQDNWGVHRKKILNLIRHFKKLPYHLIVTALEIEDRDGEMGQLMYGPDISPKKLARKIPSVFDVFFRLKVFNSENGPERFFLTEPTESEKIKGRTESLEPLEPPDWRVIFSKILSSPFINQENQNKEEAA